MDEKRNIITEKMIEKIIDNSKVTDIKMGDKTTVICVQLPNGFEIIESASCVDPANYDHKLGIKTACEKVVTKLWELEGYLLQSNLTKVI